MRLAVRPAGRERAWTANDVMPLASEAVDRQRKEHGQAT